MQIDEKGKYFTARVTKHGVSIVAATRDGIVRGILHLAQDNRLKDELNNDERFVAITQAEVWDAAQVKQLSSSPVLILNKEHIIWVVPADETQSGSQ